MSPHNLLCYTKAMGIVCLDPRRVAITGKVRAFALDKTGTLTQAWLDFLAVQPVPKTSGPPSSELKPFHLQKLHA